MPFWWLGPLGGLAEKHVRLVSGSSASNTDASISIVRVRKLYDFSVGTVVYVRVRSNANVAKEIQNAIALTVTLGTSCVSILCA